MLFERKSCSIITIFATNSILFFLFNIVNCTLLDEDNHMNSGTASQEQTAVKNLAATLESIEKREESPLMEKSRKSAGHQQNLDSDHSAEENEKNHK